jgi:hypothetical protein
MGSNSLLIRAKLPKVRETTDSQVDSDQPRPERVVEDILTSRVEARAWR